MNPESLSSPDEKLARRREGLSLVPSIAARKRVHHQRQIHEAGLRANVRDVADQQLMRTAQLQLLRGVRIHRQTVPAEASTIPPNHPIPHR